MMPLTSPSASSSESSESGSGCAAASAALAFRAAALPAAGACSRCGADCSALPPSFCMCGGPIDRGSTDGNHAQRCAYGQGCTTAASAQAHLSLQLLPQLLSAVGERPRGPECELGRVHCTLQRQLKPE